MQRVALTIAGSDSGGGAGIQADLRAFTHFGVHGCTAITALTAQNPMRVSAIQPTTPQCLAEQLNRIAEVFALGAIKTGMLVNAELIETVAQWVKTQTAPVVIDPVLCSTGGTPLLDSTAVTALLRLMHTAALITPNLPEAEALLGETLQTEEARCRATVALRRLTGASGVLLKGGHHPADPATDFYCNAQDEVFAIRAPIVPHPLTTHGTGCALASAIAANLALGQPPMSAVIRAKAYLVGALRSAVATGKSAVYGWPISPCAEREITVVKL